MNVTDSRVNRWQVKQMSKLGPWGHVPTKSSVLMCFDVFKRFTSATGNSHLENLGNQSLDETYFKS